MSAPAFSKFETLLLNQRNPLDASVLLVLGWLAVCDGPLGPAETEHLRRTAVDCGHAALVEPVMDVLGSRDMDAMQLACDCIRLHCPGPKAFAFINAAISMAVADGRFGPAENHILRFLADLLGLTPSALRYEFSRVAGQPLPEPVDPSAASSWRTSQTIRALAVLGLEERATPAQVKAAYRRLARAHHPDRFTQAGPDAVATATQTFQRIHKAYEHLVAHA